MTNSVIEKIFNYYNTFCDETDDAAENAAAKKEFTAAYERLSGKLNDDLKKELDEALYLHLGVADAGYAKKFKDGFKFGFKIAFEALSEED
ncbi:MAG: hypothetical protein K2L67_02795 [Clostridia bacterium]|nr:hypothetical protein [Clostridia bacterium]